MNKLSTTIFLFLICHFASAQNWSLTGNTGTTSSNYVGTTDANPLVFRTNGTEQFRLTPAGNIMVGKTTDDNRRLSVLGKVRVETSEALGFTIGTTPVHSQFSFDGISGSTSISLLYSRNFNTNANGSSAITGNGIAGDPANYLYFMSGAHIVGYQQPVVVKRFYPHYGSSLTVDDDGQVGVYPSDYRITSFNLNGAVKAFIDKDGGAQFNGATRIGNTTAQASAILEVASTSQGFLPPRMSTVQKTAISAPATGLLVYDNSLNNYSYYNGSAWQSLGGSTQWSISGSDILYNIGNVAIGTTNTSTGYKLAVGGILLPKRLK